MGNQHKIIGDKVTLVPYHKSHVPIYHEWMKDPFLQETTASEPLTLEQEFEMQVSWETDPCKCTFILEVGDVMVGDVNLYMFLEDDQKRCAELEVMVALPAYRSKGLGTEAVQRMMHYGINVLQIQKFMVKISSDNLPSLAMFNKLGFRATSTSIVFNETTFELESDDVAWAGNISDRMVDFCETSDYV